MVSLEYPLLKAFPLRAFQVLSQLSTLRGRVQGCYGGIVEGYFVPKSHNFRALEEDVGYIFLVSVNMEIERGHIRPM